MRFYVVAMRQTLDGEYPVRMADALEGAELHATRSEAKTEHFVMHGNSDQWEVRAVEVKWTRPRPRTRKED